MIGGCLVGNMVWLQMYERFLGFGISLDAPAAERS